jgi:NADH-quinone oxidoreductase subunit N
VNLLPAAAAGAATAFGLVAYQWVAGWDGMFGGEVFSGLVRLDAFSLFVRGFVLLFAVLLLVYARTGGLPDAADSADFAVLLLGGTLGMMLMASANHLMTVFIGLEMASLPCYALAGFLKGRKTGSEAALKYAVYGAAASGVALFGISLLVVAFGGGKLQTVARGYAEMAAGGGWSAPAVAGTVLLLAGFAFKLSAVPFHFWCPDVFDGAAAEVGAFLSVASKGAAVAVLVRFLMAAQLALLRDHPTFLPQSLGLAVLILGGVTATVGNLAALNQTSLKRMLAYSTIAHAGYMLLAVGVVTPAGVSAVLVYLAGYLPANLGAFAVVAAVRNGTGGEGIDHVRGLMKRDPGTAVCLVLFLLSLLGLPPLAGFAGKFQAFAALYDAGVNAVTHGQSGLGVGCYVLLGVAVVNTAVSAGYYLRVIRAAVLDEPTGEWRKPGEGGGVVLLLLAVAVVGLGVAWAPLLQLTARAADSF